MAEGRKIEAEVVAVQVEVRNLRQAMDRNTESLSEVREGFQRLRGEMNGILPRLEEKVGHVIERLESRDEADREYFEKVLVHENEIGTLFEQMNRKADAEANRTEHGRIWLAVRLFFYGTLAAMIGLMITEVFR